jgi:hypothetical protein
LNCSFNFLYGLRPRIGSCVTGSIGTLAAASTEPGDLRLDQEVFNGLLDLAVASLQVDAVPRKGIPQISEFLGWGGTSQKPTVHTSFIDALDHQTVSENEALDGGVDSENGRGGCADMAYQKRGGIRRGKARSLRLRSEQHCGC